MTPYQTDEKGNVTDEKGNVATVEFWGSEEAARASLKTLAYCTYCTNCIYCTYCNYCTNCSLCNNCTYCKIKGLTRSDGYTFYINTENHIRAGCRDFPDFHSAREYWKHRAGTQLGIETDAILDALEKVVELNKAETSV